MNRKTFLKTVLGALSAIGVGKYKTNRRYDQDMVIKFQGNNATIGLPQGKDGQILVQEGVEWKWTYPRPVIVESVDENGNKLTETIIMYKPGESIELHTDGVRVVS